MGVIELRFLDCRQLIALASASSTSGAIQKASEAKHAAATT